MPQRTNLTGKVFNRWRVLHLGLPGPSPKYDTQWVCQCVCGTVRVVSASNLVSGKTKSCGCYAREVRVKHGLSKTPVHAVWRAMIQRTTNPNHDQYDDYLGRGISVSESWREFLNFYADMGEPPKEHTLERIDNDKGYNKENCRWAPWSDQARNKRTNYKVTHQGNTKCLQDWAEAHGLKVSVLRRRIHEWKWPIETALTAPVLRGVPRRHRRFRNLIVRL